VPLQAREQLVVDVTVEIAHGKHSAEGTQFHIYSVVCPTKLEPLFAPMEFQVDLDKRTARIKVQGAFDITGEPIRNPVTNAPHFPRLVLPNGFEFREAELASGTAKVTGPIKYERTNGHGHFARVHWGPNGYVE
jgi:hypothetical protein